MSDEEFHKKYAKSLFNHVWTLMEKENRNDAEDAAMIHEAHASRYHWGEVGEPIHFARGEWQISRVYSVLKRPEPALFHAKECLTWCEENQLCPFDKSFAHEALARAYSIAGDTEACCKHIAVAKGFGESIKDHNEKEWLFENLNTIEA